MTLFRLSIKVGKTDKLHLNTFDVIHENWKNSFLIINYMYLKKMYIWLIRSISGQTNYYKSLTIKHSVYCTVGKLMFS